MSDTNTEIENEIRKEYGRLVGILAAFEDQAMPVEDQLIHFKGLLGVQYGYLNGLLDDEFHTGYMNMIYDKAGLHGDHKYAYLFDN